MSKQHTQINKRMTASSNFSRNTRSRRRRIVVEEDEEPSQMQLDVSVDEYRNHDNSGIEESAQNVTT